MHIAYMTNDRSEYRRGTASILMTRDKFELKVFAAKALQMSRAFLLLCHAERVKDEIADSPRCSLI